MRNFNGQAANVIVALLFFLAIILFFFIFRFPIQLSFIFILGCMVFVLSIVNTDFALIILIFSMLLSPELQIGGIRGRAVVIRVDDILLFVVFFGWLAKMAINKELGLLKTTPLNRPILIYISICVIATFLGIIRGDVKFKESFFYLLKYLEYFLLFFMVSNNIKNMRQVKIFTYLMLFVCLIVSLYAWKLHFAGVSRVTAPFEGEAGESNTLAGYLLLMIAVIMGLILHPSYNKQRFLLLGLLAFVIPTFLFTLSRSAWIAFIPMYLSLLVISRRGKGVLLLVIIVAILTLPFILPTFVKERVKSTFVPGKTYNVFGKNLNFDEATSIRIESWNYAFKKWQKRPLLGYGIPAGIVTDNQYARVLREVGIIGFMAFVWLMLMIFRIAYYTYRTSGDNNFAKGLSLGFTCGFIGLLVNALGVETFIIIRIMEPFWFLAAIVAMLPEIQKEI